MSQVAIASSAQRRSAGAFTNTRRTYSTSFPLTENPISESANWINGATNGVDWGDMRTNGVRTYGTLATTYHDNTALLTGTWAANQYCESVIYKGSPDNTYFPEVEHRLRSTITANVNSGYEISYGLRGGANSYLIVVRWNGPVTDFTYLLDAGGAGFQAVNGDVMRTEISGNIITSYLNGAVMATVDITSQGGTVYASGAPGMGTNADSGGSATLDQYGFSSFTAGEL